MRAPLICLLLAAAGAFAVEPLAIGAAVPPLAVSTLDGAATTLASLRGEGPLLLMSWCSSCHSCRGAEGPFDALAARHRGSVPMYALAANPAESVEKVHARQQTGRLAFPVALDRDGAAADALGITCTTTAILIAADGTLAYRGPLTAAQTQEALQAVIEARRPAVAEVEQRGCPLR